MLGRIVVIVRIKPTSNEDIKVLPTFLYLLNMFI